MYSGIVILSGLLILGGWFVFRGFKEYEREVSYYIPMPNAGKFHKDFIETTPKQDSATTSEYIINATTTPQSGSATAGQAVATTSSQLAPQTILLNVPFTSQAPFANWDNVIFQQGCEEGMQTFNDSFHTLIKTGMIELEEALNVSENPEELNMMLQGIRLSSGGGGLLG